MLTLANFHVIKLFFTLPHLKTVIKKGLEKLI